ncbi:protein of unknown function [Methylocaldum szegediense]|uniref:Uncharacterized protein n=1 Tax=Methylocaldum szegediense TaxID=73780 RepID=A0ABM9I9K0_9GAMM|nr:protein of unknown function [Methylocaldum szegediense]
MPRKGGLRGACPEPFDNAQDSPVEEPVPSGAERLTCPTSFVGNEFPTLYYEFRVVRKGLEKTPDRSPQAWRALQV